MKDYEHMMIALDEYISHNVAAVICIENYHDKSIPKAFRNIFDVFSLYRKDYEENTEKYEKGCAEDKIQFQMRCREKREDMLKWFIEELKEINSDIDYEQVIAKYLDDLDNEDIQTPEMYLDIYPMLISLIRKKEEEV
ncbi:MAG: hypothetical protein NC240_10475 [Clostridium sp.]|nr:hypothetical protein [Clostridium sp.]